MRLIPKRVVCRLESLCRHDGRLFASGLSGADFKTASTEVAPLAVSGHPGWLQTCASFGLVQSVMRRIDRAGKDEIVTRWQVGISDADWHHQARGKKDREERHLGLSKRVIGQENRWYRPSNRRGSQETHLVR